METLNQASKQWATRPDDQRYLSLDDLHTAVSARRVESWTATPQTNALRVLPSEGGLSVELFDPVKCAPREVYPTNWAFNQLSQYAQAPAAYMRQLPPELAAINLQYGLENRPLRSDSLILAQSNGTNELRSMTSTSYGRIWDQQVVEAVQRVNHDGRWQVPAASYAATNPKRATTLYASDRDVFIFLVDPQRPIEVGDDTLFRGFFAYNSEVGSSVFGLTTFLYRYVCDNRIVFGAANVQELRIRHTSGAPDRFAYEGAKYLERYADESTGLIVEQIKRAKTMEIPLKRDESVTDWLQTRGFTKPQAAASVQMAAAEEGQARSVFDIINGITAYARSISHTNARVELETKAGKIMELVS